MSFRLKRILYIEANRDGTVGGSYFSLLYLLRALDRRRFEPHVLFFQGNVLIPEFRKVAASVRVLDVKPSDSQPNSNPVDWLKVPARFVRDILLSQERICHILGEANPDLVHLNNGYSALHEWVWACGRRNIPVVAHDRGTRYPCSLRTRWFVRRMNAVISVSEAYRDNLVRQGLKPRRLERVYNGIDLAQMPTAPEGGAREALRCGLKLGDGPVVGMVGNIDRWKGQHVFLNALARIREKIPGMQALIVGPIARGAERYRDELERFVAENSLEKIVTFAGYRKDVHLVMTQFDVMVHASVEPEPFARVILEGMALAKPIIATNAGGCPEQIIDGETGLLVPMSDADALARAILFLLSNPGKATEMGIRGQERVNRVFTIHQMVARVEAIYDDIFAAQSGAAAVVQPAQSC